jgi:hypothetical protein
LKRHDSGEVFYEKLVSHLDMRISISGTGWYPIPAGKSKTKTIDVRKWEIVDGWIAGKYQLLFRADKIDVDSHTWINVTSDPITIEIK